MFNKSFFKGKKILITGHTGFKGSWMCKVLLNLGAEITGYALQPPTEPSLFSMLQLEDKMNSVEGDVRDLSHLWKVFAEVQPEIVIHMAAQPIVRESYINPVYTYDVNVMGTVNVLECVRRSSSVKSVINVTTDKVYKNHEWEWGYRECDEINGFDPYSNSKSCSELVTDSYRNSYFADRKVAISTVRAGNVVGGGDFAKERIVPDCMRAVLEKKEIILRNPHSTRPYQHVLEPIFAYLLLAQKQYEDVAYAGSYNVGPNDESCLTTQMLVEEFCAIWNQKTGEKQQYRIAAQEGPHEANFLKLDCSKIRHRLKWQPVWNWKYMIAAIVEWIEEYSRQGDVNQIIDKQIDEYVADMIQK